MLTASNIEKSFGNKKVLDGVHLTVHQGDVVVILGPSGSGKTTLLRTLNHLEKADKGQLTLDGKTYDLAKIQQKEILELRKKTAFVFQNYNLFANKTAIENILEGLVIARKIPKKRPSRSQRRPWPRLVYWTAEMPIPASSLGDSNNASASPEPSLSNPMLSSLMNRHRPWTQN